MNWTNLILALAAMLALGSAPAHAGIVGGSVVSGRVIAPGGPAFSGVFQQLVPADGPFSVGTNNFDTPNLYAFTERQNVAVTAGLVFDLGASLAAGTPVNSHYVFFDALTNTRVNGHVDFDGVILGLFHTSAAQQATDYLGAANVTYLYPRRARGLEPTDDFVSFNGNRLTVDLLSSNPGDYIRVLTSVAVPGSPGTAPEPSTWATLIGGFGLIGGALRRRRSQALATA